MRNVPVFDGNGNGVCFSNAQRDTNLSLAQVITVSSSPGMDSDWLMGERGNQKGKVPITYLELLN